MTDMNGVILECNEAVGRMFGMAKSQIVGQPVWGTIYGLAAAPKDSPLETIRRTFRRVSLVRTIGEKSYGIRVDPLLDRNGRLVGAIHLTSDITERLQRTQFYEGIELSRENLSAIIEAAPVAIIATDLMGDVIGWNPAAERMFGWTSVEVIGKPNPTVPPDTEEDNPTSRRAHVMTGKTLSGVAAHRKKKDGTPVEVNFSLGPLRDHQGNVNGIIAIVTDITELKRARETLSEQEVEIRQLQKMESMGRLAGGMAHDFNNILTAVMGYSDILVHKLEFDQTLRGYAESILKSAERAAGVCDRLLTFSRRQVVNLDILDLGEVIGRMAEMFPPLLGNSIKLTVVPAPENLRPIKGNEGQLAQVIMNLVVNAQEAMPNGGEVIIETSNVQLDKSYTAVHPGIKPGAYIMLAVSDTGIGMDAQTKAHVFDPFFTTKREPGKEGTGLGLSTTYGIIHQIGGHISLYSELGMGTTFKVYFPQAEKKAVQEASMLRVIQGGIAPAKGTVTMEDQQRLRDLITETLLPGRPADQTGPETPARSPDITAPGVPPAPVGSAEPDLGALVREVMLPDHVGSPSTVERPPENSRGNGESILVVEDRPELRELIDDVLSREGYTVVTAHDGQDALRIIQERPEAFHIVLTDIVMPGMNGHDLAVKLSVLRPNLKILFMSGYTSTVLTHQNLLGKNMPFIHKPFTPQVLANKIREVLDDGKVA